jgi:hypothetical protein
MGVPSDGSKWKETIAPGTQVALAFVGRLKVPWAVVVYSSRS